MKTVVTDLFEIQKSEFLSTKPAPAALRNQIPSEMLEMYERFRLRGRKAVALVRNGVCGECHLRIPVGVLVEVMRGEVQRCGNCGRYLYLPEGAVLTVSSSSSVAKTSEPRRKRKKAEPTAQAA
jgi:predicted  nucleic acid-binding Zn-ribbon protein